MRPLPLFRTCGMCHSEKTITEFNWRRKGKGWFDNYCRPCRAAYKQKHYQANKERYKANAAAHRHRLLQERNAALIEFFRENPCADCGERDPVVLEFDHLGEKAFEIAYGIRNFSWEMVLAEIEKCDVVCANCHRRRTAKRGGFMRLLLSDSSG